MASGAGVKHGVKGLDRHFYKVPAQILIAYIAAVKQPELNGCSVVHSDKDMTLPRCVVSVCAYLNKTVGVQLVEEVGKLIFGYLKASVVKTALVPGIVSEVEQLLCALGQQKIFSKKPAPVER